MRKTDDPMKMAFVADADALYPNQKKDFNGDGVINDADAISFPGDLYDDDEFPQVRDTLIRPLAGIGTDQWGTFISAQAPISDKNGNAVAVLGIDMFASNLDRLSADSFTPLYAFIGFFLFFLLIRFWSENRSLMEECGQAMRRNMRIVILWSVFIPLFILAIMYAFQQYKYHLLIEQTGKRLMAIVATAAHEFDPDDLNQLHWAKDMKTEAYQRVFKLLNDIREKNPDIIYAYWGIPLSELTTTGRF
jgi:hypothetical protein